MVMEVLGEIVEVLGEIVEVLGGRNRSEEEC